MPSIILVLSLFWGIAHGAKPEWIEQADIIINNEPNAHEATAKLLAMPDLDTKLKAGIEVGGAPKEYALSIIRKLPRFSMASYLDSRTKKISPENEAELVTLMSLASRSPGKEILSVVKNKIDPTSEKFSSPLKASYLAMLMEKDETLPVSTLLKLLDEKSYDIRLQAYDLAESEIKKNPTDYEGFLHKAMRSSPYPLRQRTALYLLKATDDFKKKFTADIENCAKNDQSQIVKEICVSLRK